MKISKYLTYEEAIKSATALRLGINNDPDPIQFANMKYVAEEIFDKVRDFVGGPLFASSFFRSKELNDAVPGSSKTSQHMTGQAIDIDADTFGHGSNKAIFDFIRNELVFDELIGEYPDKFGNFAWVHVSKKRTDNRGKILIKLKGPYIYFKDYKLGMV